MLQKVIYFVIFFFIVCIKNKLGLFLGVSFSVWYKTDFQEWRRDENIYEHQLF